MAQEIPNDLTLSALKIEPTSISSNPALDVNGSMVGHRRNIITLNTENASNPRILKVAESGSLIIIDNSSDVDIVIGLPTIEPGNVGTYYDFIITGVHDTKSIKIKTGGHASTINEENRTNEYDSFTGCLLSKGTDKTTTVQDTNGNPSSYDLRVSTFNTLKPDTEGIITINKGASANIKENSQFRCTSITSSTTTNNIKVWFLQGLLYSNDDSPPPNIYIDI